MYHTDQLVEDQETLKDIMGDMISALNDADTPFALKTDLASTLWEIGQQCLSAIEPTKDIVRSTATPFLREESEWSYSTPLGRAIRVKRQKPNYFVNNAEPLKDLLGASFNTFVDTKYNLKKGALETLSEDHDLYRQVLSLIEVRESKPRVSFRSADQSN